MLYKKIVFLTCIVSMSLIAQEFNVPLIETVLRLVHKTFPQVTAPHLQDFIAASDSGKVVVAANVFDKAIEEVLDILEKHKDEVALHKLVQWVNAISGYEAVKYGIYRLPSDSFFNHLTDGVMQASETATTNSTALAYQHGFTGISPLIESVTSGSYTFAPKSTISISATFSGPITFQLADIYQYAIDGIAAPSGNSAENGYGSNIIFYSAVGVTEFIFLAPEGRPFVKPGGTDTFTSVTVTPITGTYTNVLETLGTAMNFYMTYFPNKTLFYSTNLTGLVTIVYQN